MCCSRSYEGCKDRGTRGSGEGAAVALLGMATRTYMFVRATVRRGVVGPPHRLFRPFLHYCAPRSLHSVRAARAMLWSMRSCTAAIVCDTVNDGLGRRAKCHTPCLVGVIVLARKSVLDCQISTLHPARTAKSLAGGRRRLAGGCAHSSCWQACSPCCGGRFARHLPTVLRSSPINNII